MLAALLRLWSATPTLLRALLLLSGAVLVADQVATWHVNTLPMRAPRAIHEVEVTPEELARRIATAEPTGTTVLCRRLGMELLGLTAPSSALRPPAATAAYIQGTDTVFVAPGGAGALPHERIHALEDQVSDRLRRTAEAATSDEQWALRAAIEGTAVVFGGGGSRRRGSASDDLGARLHTLFYAAGPVYVARRAGSSFQGALALAPTSTAEVLTGARTDPVNPSPSLAEADCSDRLGAVGVYTAMARAGARSDAAARVASEWAGDRVDVAADGERTQVSWRAVFTSGEAAALWEAAATDLAQGRADIRAVVIEN